MVLMERLTPQDCAVIAGWCRDRSWDDLIQWAGHKVYQYPLTAEQIAPRLGEADTLMYKVMLDGEMIGCVELYRVDREKAEARVCRFLLREDMRGKGYGSAVLREISRIAFRELGLKSLTLGVFCYNVGALRCYENAGFRVESFREGETPTWNAYDMRLRDEG